MVPSSSWLSIVSFLLFVAVLLLYKYMTRHFGYWNKRGVYTQMPMPFFGNSFDLFTFKYSLGDWLRIMCETIDRPYFGLFMFDKPCLVINDTDLISNILIKDFNVFRDRSVASGEHNEAMRELMFFQKYSHWKTIRLSMASVFSSAKLKRMFVMINKVGADFADFLEEHLGDTDDIKTFVTKFSLELFSQLSASIKTDAFTKENTEFLRYSGRIFETTIKTSFYQLCFFFRRGWVRRFSLTFFSSDVLLYFQNLFLHIIESRKNNGIKNYDILDLISETRRNGDANLSDRVIAARVMNVFVGGFETTTSTISFLIYELARNSKIQERLRKEILEVTEKHGGITYEAISEMKYLDQCLFESLRKYPTVPILDRRANEDYRLPGTDLIIEKGMNVYIPIYALHFNEKYFPDPYVFNPDRFEAGTDDDRDAMRFIAFGAGPRVCFGERFGVLACKACICHLLSNFEVLQNARTQNEIKLSVKSQLMVAEGGLPMRLRKYVPESGQAVKL